MLTGKWLHGDCDDGKTKATEKERTGFRYLQFGAVLGRGAVVDEEASSYKSEKDDSTDKCQWDGDEQGIVEAARFQTTGRWVKDWEWF